MDWSEELGSEREGSTNIQHKPLPDPSKWITNNIEMKGVDSLSLSLSLFVAGKVE